MQSNTKFKVIIKREVMLMLVFYIPKLEYNNAYLALQDKLLLQTLMQLYVILGKRLVECTKKEYKVTLQPTHALGLALFYQKYVNDCTTYEGNQLHLLHNSIIQKFTT